MQTVVADDPADTAQTDLVRRHLRDETDRLGRGDYTDPGGEITYTTNDPALVAALHAWFDAQVSDHGRHAEHG